MREGKYFVDTLGTYWVQGDKDDEVFEGLKLKEFKKRENVLHYELDGVHYYNDGHTMLIDSPRYISLLEPEGKKFKNFLNFTIKPHPFGHCICEGLNYYRLKTLVQIKAA